MFDLLRHPRVRTLMAEDRPRHRIAILAMTGRALFGLGVPYFFGDSVQLIIDGASHGRVLGRVGIMLAISIATAICQYWMRWIYIGSSRDFERRLRDSLFAHISRLSFSWFSRARTGDVMSRLTADVEAVRMGVGPGVMHLYQTAVMATGAILVMLVRDWQLTLLSLLPLLGILFAIKSLMPRMHAASLRVQEQLSKVSELAQESFSGARVVKTFAREDYEIARFGREASRYIDDSMRLARLRAWMHVGIEVLAGMVSMSVLWFGGRAVLRGELSAGALISFFGYFMMLVWPMIAVGWTMSLFQRAIVSLGRLEEVFASKPEIESGALAPAEIQGAWSIRGLDFSHAGATRPALSGFSLEIPAGASVAVTGPIGSGKSTLAQILGRLVEPPPGTVFLDGRDVRDLDLGVLRRSIAMVPQDTFLFSDTLHANIAYARPDAARSEVEAAARATCVHEAILGFPEGYDTVIGERGITLSGGQKQRVAIARALLHQAPTLILDDCLSAVDTDTEEKILRHLERAMERRTTLMIAHRLSSIRHCDRIVVLDRGRVIEAGTHEELLALDGWYADTWRRQLVQKELETA